MSNTPNEQKATRLPDHDIPQGFSAQGHVLVCRNEKQFVNKHETPREMWSERDWDFLQKSLDRSYCTIVTETAHKNNPNIMNRRRLVVSSRFDDPHKIDDVTVLWNPETVPLQEALKGFPGGGTGLIAVCGDRKIFEIFLSLRLEKLYVTRINRAAYESGEKLFKSGSIADNLKRLGYTCVDTSYFDENKEEVFERWEKKPK